MWGSGVRRVEAELVRSDHGSLDQGLTTPGLFSGKMTEFSNPIHCPSHSPKKKKKMQPQILTLAFLRHKVFTDVIELN